MLTPWWKSHMRLSRRTILAFCFLIYSCCFVIWGAATAHSADWSRVLSSLPYWPIKDVDPKIPQAVIDHWKTFGFSCPAKDGAYGSYPTKWAATNWPEHCDDLDSTLFNGLLCASGLDAAIR
jgi:hypothetical protein